MKFSFLNKYTLMSLAAASALLVSCQPDDDGNSNGLTNEMELDAAFTVEPIDGSVNRLRLQGDTGALTHMWNGQRGVDYKDMVFALAGTYSVEHMVCGIGGTDCQTTTQTIEVPTNIPIEVNLIDGGEFSSQADIDQWSVMGGGGADWIFNDGKATLSATGQWSQKVLYQTFEVEGGHDYLIDMHVSSTAPMDQTFFEVYAGYGAPVSGQDYNEGGKILQINTWDGCGTTPFDGQLTAMSCGATMGGVRHFDQSGTVYLVIRGGSGAPPFSISIDNVVVGKID